MIVQMHFAIQVSGKIGHHLVKTPIAAANSLFMIFTPATQTMNLREQGNDNKIFKC